MNAPAQQTTRNLVILRAGDNSLHREWIANPDRDFDLFISYYGKEESRYKGESEYHEMRKGPKWPCIKELLDAHPELLERYSSFWFPDDDISVSTETINRLFGLFRGFKLSLAQPALTRDSYYSWEQLLQRDDFLLRYVDFIEVMVPLFSREALKTCINTFDENRSGWGLDWVWPKLIGNQSLRGIAVIDATPVKHTRPLGGELYKNNPEMNPANEAAKIFEKYKIKNIRAFVQYALYGGVGYTQPKWRERITLSIKLANAHRKAKRDARKPQG
ncbi:MAG TPA: DUF707 domain-containing protein [Aquabacterium sp.]|nr:DUF707 domain-containing protein [Aquabacterium sp.]